MPQVRPYAGVEAPERSARRRRRFVDAGLDLLGGTQAPAELTVRAVCRQAGLAARYFYEGFTDKDHFVAAVFDDVVTGLATTTLAAVAAAPAEGQSLAGMANIVRAVDADRRVGRLLFSSELSNPVVARKRAESVELFAVLLFQHAGSLGAEDSQMIRAAAHFAVGGVSQTISAWLASVVELTVDEVIRHLATTIDALAQPGMYD